MFLANTAVWEESYCGILSPTLIKICLVSSGSHDLAGQAFLFLSGFLFSFFSPPISPVFFLFLILIYLSFMTKNLPDKEQKKEGLRRRLANDCSTLY